MNEGEGDPGTWELSKENILPLKQGRKADVLSFALDDTAARKLNSTRHEFEEELRTYNGDDPLDVWYRYALWVEQNYPKGGKDGNLMKLIEKCVKSIHSNGKTSDQYKNDSRFLALWVKYAHLCPNPRDIYGALESKGLCTGLAEFYISWAWEFEMCKNYRKADAIYQKGIQAGALPFDVLQEAHKKFQTRVARATVEGMGSEAEDNSTEPQRIALTALKVQGRKNKAPVERVGPSAIGPAGRIAPLQPTVNTGGPAFSIFQDNGTGNSIGGGCENKGGSLPVHGTINKENMKNPAQWTKAKVNQKTTGVVPVEDVGIYQQPAFSVHQDEGASQLTKAPSKLPETSNVLSVRKKAIEDWQVPLFVAEPFDPKVQPQYCKHKVYCGTEEFSFEELRSAKYFRKMREEEEKKQAEEAKNAEMEQMKDMLMKQEQLIQQLMQGMSAKQDQDPRQKQGVHPPPDVVVTSPVEDMVSSIAHRKEQRHENRDRSTFQDSWICINKSVNASVNASVNNVSHFLDESSTHALLQLKPATLTPVIDELDEPDYAPPVSNISGQDHSNSSHSNSRVLNMTEPTFNTKLAMHAVNEMWSASILKDDNIAITKDSNNVGPVKQSAPFSIFQDDVCNNKEEESSVQGASQPFFIYSDTGNHLKGEPHSFQPSTVFEDNPSAPCLSDPYSDMQDENRPPVGYKQMKEGRSLAGILQPATNVPFTPLEEQKMDEAEEKTEDDGSCKEENNDDDFEDIAPLNNTSLADFTFKMPMNPEAFAKAAHVASTPAPWSLGQIPQAKITDDDYTMAVMKVASHFPLIEDPLEDEAKDEDSGELMPPPTSLCPPPTPPESTNKPSLSPIMEASREYRSSSSSSSGYSTTSTTLGATSAHGVTQLVGLSQSSRSRQYSNTQADWAHEGGTSSQTGDFTKSGYLADRSRGESLADSRPYAAHQSHAKDDDDLTFDPGQAAAMLLEMEGLPAKYLSRAPIKETLDCRVNKTSALRFPEKINPFDEELLGQLLNNLEESVESRGGFVPMFGKVPSLKPNKQLTLGQEMFHVRRIRGVGAYAKVFQAATLDPMNVTFLPTSTEDEYDDDDEDEELQMILKVQQPPCPWEFYICHELRKRLKTSFASTNMLDSVMRINRGYFYSDGSILVNQYHKYGTLIDMVNGYKNAGKTVPEAVIFVFLIEVLSIIEALHSCKIIHADIKPDNFLIREIPKINASSRTPEEMFEHFPCFLKLIDFGRSIDMKLLPEGTTFTEKVTTENFTCCEMRENRPWTYQTDLYGIAAIAHCFLFGSYMDVKKGRDDKWEPKNATIKRYWKKDLWENLFSTLLNVPSCSAIPSLTKLKRDIMAEFFAANMQNEIRSNFSNLTAILIQKK